MEAIQVRAYGDNSSTRDSMHSIATQADATMKNRHVMYDRSDHTSGYQLYAIILVNKSY